MPTTRTEANADDHGNSLPEQLTRRAEYGNVDETVRWLTRWWLDPGRHDDLDLVAIRNAASVEAAARRLLDGYLERARTLGIPEADIAVALEPDATRSDDGQ